MKKTLLYLFYSLLFFLPVALHAQTANHVVISEIYGGNGNSYSYDWIELYNPTNADIDMSNWSAQYNSATGTGAWSGLTVFPAGSIIKSHGYFLIQEQGTAATGSLTLPTADLVTTGTTNNFNMSSVAGKVALLNIATIIGSQPTLPNSTIVDLVGYGTTAAYYEGTAAAPPLTTTSTIERKVSAASTATTMAAGGSEDLKGNGWDSDNNGNDFFVPTVMNPQNSASPLEPAASATPTLVLAPTTLTFSQTVGGTSAAQSFSVSGTNIPSAGASVSVAAPYAISATSGGTYGTTLTFTQAQLASAQNVYVQFTPTVAGAANGTATVTAGATSQTVTLNGTGTAASTGANHVVISEIYGGNGNSYSYDWIELYNPTSADVDMSNWSAQYNSATGTGAWSGLTVFPAGSIIKSHGYFLIQEQGTAATGSLTLPTADLVTTGTTNNFNMSSVAGKVALLNIATIIGSQPTLPNSTIVDLVGYGTTAAYYEGSAAAPPLTTTSTIERKASATSTATTMAAGGTEDLKGNGYDTDNNGNDFFVPTLMNPQNSASPLEPAVVTGPTLTATPSTLTFSQAVGGTSAAQSFSLSGVNLTAGASLSVAAPYAISATSGGTYGTTLTYTQAQVTTGQTVYVQFTPTVAGAANGTIAITSGSATQSVTLNGSGTTAAAPTLAVTPATLTFSQANGSTSASQSFSVSGTNIPSTGVSVTVAAPYAISATSTGTYGTSLTFTQAQMATAQTVYVQFSPTTVGASNGTATVSATNATSQTVTLNGTGTVPINTPPTLNAINDVTVCYTSAQQTIALTGVTPGAEATQTVILSVTSTNPALFSQLGVFTISGGTTGQINYTIAPNASGTAVVTVTVKDNGGTANGGVDTYTRSFNITVNSLPNVNIVSNAGTTITKGVTAQLTATPGATTYTWSSSLGAAAGDIIGANNTSTLIVRPKSTATYTLVASNASSCPVTQTITLTVNTFYPLVTNNIITPNGDGKNDTWIIKNIDYYPTSSVKVVDKAGKVVFTATNYLNDWGGTYNGQPLTQGTYYYVIDLGTGAPKYTGYVNIIRD
ncbi:lamin tail domain-containing protein [Mucilaginibacter sp. AW1-3]